MVINVPKSDALWVMRFGVIGLSLLLASIICVLILVYLIRNIKNKKTGWKVVFSIFLTPIITMFFSAILFSIVKLNISYFLLVIIFCYMALWYIFIPSTALTIISYIYLVRE